MLELEGEYGRAKVFVNEIEASSKSQIERLLDQDFIESSKIRIMPDVHAGMGCVIGFTADMKDKVVPNIVGVDIGCGMLTIKLGKLDIDLKLLDEIINKKIPSGRNTHNNKLVDFDKLEDLYCYRELNNTRRIERSIGSLGGGNHFIEMAEDSHKNKYLIIHSGSRNLGNQVAKHYQNIAIDMCSGKEEYYNQKNKLIEDYRQVGKNNQIPKALKKLNRKYPRKESKYAKDLCYLSGDYRKRYLHDMNICQEYASLNRKTMANIILDNLFNKNLDDYDHFETIHNYINFKDNIIRKGAISAYKDEEILIPINMRDGSILARGKGNPDWNYSAPHGAGRVLSRTEAYEKLDLNKFKEAMADVYSTSVSKKTLDESPDAYKPIEEIIDSLDETAEIIDILRPIYNYKA